ncbi:MAG: FAD-dependent oxidoreductase [Bacilli bacterium]|nr:FAD-dependent oxidoreductase [Bacilli bacterium]
MKTDIVIIGAGVAGMTSAIYLKRAGINCILIEAKKPGGQINFASDVENYPGFEKISGRDFSLKVFEQVKSLSVDYLNDEVVSLEKEIDEFVLNTKNNGVIFSKNIIVATGKKIKKLDVPNVNSYLGVGLSYCATCDGRFFSGKDVLVVGDTNKAIEEALYLTNICNKVTILCEKSVLRADSFYVEKLKEVNNVEIIYNSSLKELVKKEVLIGAIIEKDGEQSQINIDGCFAYVGYVPNSELVSHLVELNGDNYIIVDENKQTSCKGIYAVGDVTDTKVYQLITAASDAVIAVNSYLSCK